MQGCLSQLWASVAVGGLLLVFMPMVHYVVERGK